MFKHFKFVTSAVLALMLTLMVAGLVSASTVYKTPSYGSAVVDGNSGEWNLTNDWFADMCGGFDCGSHPTTSKLYLRYECSTQTVYALVKVQAGHTMDPTSSDDAWIAVNLISNKVVSKTSGNNGVPPDFAWLSTNDGYEASFSAAAYGSSFTLKAHINVDGGQTSGSTWVGVKVACTSASTTRSGNLNNTSITPGTPISDTMYLTATAQTSGCDSSPSSTTSSDCGSIAPNATSSGGTTIQLAGTVQFYYCASLNIAVTPDCNTATLYAIGSPVAVTPSGPSGGKVFGTASSINVAFNSGGQYCFKAVFTPSSGSPYSGVSETNQLLTGGRAECILVSAPTAVTVSSFEATNQPAMTTDASIFGLSLAGLLALGGVALIVWRKQ